jgi:MFS transporter, Spinster family, sphingosine-1-phosphate transporter
MNARSYRRYLLAVLMVILAFNYVDRLALGLLLQDIKADIHITDTQLGVLSGIAFALFYSIMGIPIARWADRGNRASIITVTTALWSIAVALCGTAGTFLQLLVIRVGVAVGEAGCIPPAHSLIADYFTRTERPRAVAIYMLGAPLSMLVGYLVAGWLNELYGWRMTFVLLGLPGVVLALLAWFTLRDPRRSSAGVSVISPIPLSANGNASTAEPSMKEVCLTLWSKPTFRHLLLCFSVVSFFGYGLLQWQPAFFVRSYGLQTGELGTWFALITGGGGLLGTYLGGEWASRHAAGNERLQLRGIAVMYCAFGAISACAYVVTDYHVAFALMAVATVGIYSVSGPLFATIQTLVPARMRAMSIAILYLFANLVGMGFGPLAAGALSDAFRPWAGEESLRYALLVLCPGYVWAATHLWLGSRTVVRDLAADE